MPVPNKGRVANLADIVGESPKILELRQKIQTFAPSDATVLILGESGTGKELVAGSLHSSSRRRSAEFVAINCAAFPETLLESELFGHEKGAFTGAQKKLGLVEEADGGTLFLDEIAEMSRPLQIKLLRFLENGTFRRVGNIQQLRVNVRLIAATNRNISQAIREKEFREDFFFRLGAVRLPLPPLRERGEDVLLLANHFLKQFVAANHKKVNAISAAAGQRLLAYRWPGNARELRHVIEFACIVETTDEIQPSSLGDFDQGMQPLEATPPPEAEATTPKQHLRLEGRDAQIAKGPPQLAGSDGGVKTIVFVDDFVKNRKKFEEAAAYCNLKDLVRRHSGLPAETDILIRCFAPSDIPKDKAIIKSIFSGTLLLLVDMDFTYDGPNRIWPAGQYLLLHLFDAHPELSLRTIWITKTGMNGLNEEYMRITNEALGAGDADTQKLVEKIPLLPRSIVESLPPPLPDQDNPWWSKVWEEILHVLATCEVRQMLPTVQKHVGGRMDGDDTTAGVHTGPVGEFVAGFMRLLPCHGSPPYRTTIIKDVLQQMHTDWYLTLPSSRQMRVLDVNQEASFIDALMNRFTLTGAAFVDDRGRGVAKNTVRTRIQTNFHRLTGEQSADRLRRRSNASEKGENAQ